VFADLFVPLNPNARLDLVPAELMARTSRPDVIVATGPGWQCFEFGHRLAQAWNTLLMLDYRDPWTIALPEVGLRLMTHTGKGLIGQLRARRMRRAELLFTTRAVAVTAATPAFLENALRIIGQRPGLAVLNGHHPGLRITTVAHTRFTMLYTGSVYEEQEWDLVLEGLKILELARPDLTDSLTLHLVGIDLKHIDRSRPVLEELVRRREVRSEGRMDRDSTIRIQAASDVLLHVGFKGKQGILPLKFLEYLHAGAPILQVSSGRDMQEHIIEETSTGMVVGSGRAFADHLASAMDHWKTHGHLPYAPDQEALRHYTWEYQMERWRGFMLTTVEHGRASADQVAK
jgi:glycosyltransferase involved in cell wall biosynthesis